MIIDTSAWLRVLLQEPGWEAVADAMTRAQQRYMSTVNLCELLIRLKDLQPRDFIRLRGLVLASPVNFVAPDARVAELAAEARHRLPLNLRDCFAYALAKTMAMALLTTDTAFKRAGIALVKS